MPLCFFPLLAFLLAACSALHFTPTASIKKDSAVLLKEQNLQKLATYRKSSDWKETTFEDTEVLNKISAGAKPHLIISLDTQRGYFLTQDLVALEFPIASGRLSFPTPTGKFSILEKKKTYNSNLYGKVYDAEGKIVDADADRRTATIPEGGKFVGASMPFWMRLTNDGVGLHVGYIPGRPASHGCIRIPRAAAQKIFPIVSIGTPVEILKFWEPPDLAPLLAQANH